jgi:hypothetical protein
MGMGQNPIPLVNIKIAGKWMFIPLKMVCIGIDPYPNQEHSIAILWHTQLRTSPAKFREPGAVLKTSLLDPSPFFWTLGCNNIFLIWLHGL